MAVRSIDLKVIVGLGNPGPKYTETRHNAGFWFIEQVARKYSATFRPEKKFHGEVAKISLQGKDIWLLKPDTFMNRSGLAVQSLLSFYRITAEQLLVAHDEIDLPPGTAKLKTGGGHGGHNGLRDIMMCVIPSNAVLADRFLERYDGFSIGSNDMTQFTLGLDRDSAIIAELFDERDDAVKAMLSMAIRACNQAGKYFGICGQGPSDHPELAQWLRDEGIESVSLNTDTVVETWM